MATLEDWQRAGRIAAALIERGKKLIKPGVRLLDIATTVEDELAKAGAALAFPINLSLNSTAAHDTPEPGDPRVLDESHLVKLDIGVCVNGAIADRAVTVDLTESWKELVKASEEALEAALKLATPGTALCSIGRAISEIIESYGYKTIRNLSGHGLSEWSLHTGLSIPNHDNKDMRELSAGSYIAIEPFATDGGGMVGERGEPKSWSLVQSKAVRDPVARVLLRQLGRFKGLPFSLRQLTLPGQSLQRLRLALRALDDVGALKSYPPLIERANGMVSQAEHTVLVAEKPQILSAETF